MNPDMILIAGLAIGALAIPAAVSAFSDKKTPRVPAGFFLLGAAMIFLAAQLNPQGYALADVPMVFFDVLGRIIP